MPSRRHHPLRKIGAALAFCLVLAGLGARADAACDPGKVELRGPGGKATFSVAVADDFAERAQGLMFVDSMPRMSGMLFVYEAEQPISFWMKNTLIPLDMIFMDAAGRVVHVHANAKPHDLTPVPSMHPARFVLEVNGGLAAKLRIGVGTEMRHSAVDQSIAAWRCE